MKTEQQLKNIEEMLFFLKMALKRCSIYQDIIGMAYDQEKEAVIVSYCAGTYAERKQGITYTLEINVACDSNSAMIKDVITRLDSFFG